MRLLVLVGLRLRVLLPVRLLVRLLLLAHLLSLASQGCHCLCTICVVLCIHLISHGNPARQSVSGLASHPLHLLLVRLPLTVLVVVAVMVTLVMHMKIHAFNTLSGHGTLVCSHALPILGSSLVMCHHSPPRRCNRHMASAAAACAPSCRELQSRCRCAGPASRRPLR